MGTSAGAAGRGELASLSAWYGITSFPICSDLVVGFNTGLGELLQACWESDLV